MEDIINGLASTVDAALAILIISSVFIIFSSAFLLAASVITDDH